jgi:hypothetical protein
MRYYFDLVRAHETVVDQVGIELADFDHVPAYILEALAELRAEDSDLTDQCRGWMLAVRDASRGVVLTVNLETLELLSLFAIAMHAFNQLAIYQGLVPLC